MLYATKPLENPLKYGLQDTKMGVKAMVYWVLESYGYFLVTELVDAQNYGLLEVMGFLRDGL